MVTGRTGMKLVVGLSGVLGLLAGCATERMARTGSVLAESLQPGQGTPDFSFVGENGKMETFGSVRGVVTLVVFPVSPAWPECSRCVHIAKLAGRAATGTTPVTVVSVVTSPEGGKQLSALHACRVKSFSQLIALHDRDRRLESLFGSKAAGRFYVIDFRGSVSATGLLDDYASMESALATAVTAHDEYWQQIGGPRYEG